MSTAVAQPVQTIKAFTEIIDRRHVEESTNGEVPSGTETSAFPAACGAEGRQRPSYLMALLRSFAAFAA